MSEEFKPEKKIEKKGEGEEEKEVKLDVETEKQILFHLGYYNDRDKDVFFRLREMKILPDEEYKKLAEANRLFHQEAYEQLKKGELSERDKKFHKELRSILEKPTEKEKDLAEIIDALSGWSEGETNEDMKNFINLTMERLKGKKIPESAERKRWVWKIGKLQEKKKKEGTRKFREETGGVSPP